MNKSNRLHIAIVIHSHVSGGAEMHILRLVNGLLERGHTVTYAGPMDSWLGNKFKSEINHIHLPLWGNGYDFLSILRLSHYLKRQKVDLIHSHVYRGAYYGRLTSKFSGVPCVTTVHGEDSIHGTFYNGIEKKIIAVSEATKNYLISKGLPGEKIEVVYNGICPIKKDDKKRDRIRRELGLNEGEIAVAIVARVSREKGHDILIEALKGTSGFCVFLIGEITDSKYFDKVLFKIKEYGLENIIKVLGYRSDIGDILQGIDILVAPSRSEGFGLSILEAMSLGIPVVASRVGGIPELINDGENGFLFEPGDPAMLRNRLKILVENSALCKKFSAASLKISGKFSLDRMVNRLVEIYDDVTASSNHG